MNLVTRAEWGAKRPKSTPMKIGTVDGLAVHWEGPPMGTPPHADCAQRVRAIQRYHQVTKGWADIAYSFVVCPHGATFEGRGWGVRSAANGTQLANQHYHALCYLGGEGDPFTVEAQAAIVQAVAESRRRYPAGSAVCPHSVFRPTACPGDVIRRWLASDPFTAPTPAPLLAGPTIGDDMLIAYIDGGAAYLITGGVKILLHASEIERLKAVVPVVNAPELIAATPDAAR